MYHTSCILRHRPDKRYDPLDNGPRIMLAYLCAAQYKVDFIVSFTNTPTSFFTLITYSSFPLIVVMCPSF